jgi:fucose permease
MFGWFLLACGLLSAWIVRVADVAVLLRAAIAAIGVGLAVMASGHHVAVTMAGAVIVGLGGAVMVLVSPQIISAHHGPESRAAAFTYINGLSQIGSIGAPLLLALTLHQSWGWRWPMAAIGLVGGAVVLAAAVRTDLPHHVEGAAGPRTGALTHLRRLPAARLRWLVLTLGISVEFATLFWASASVQELAGASSSAGAVGVGLFAGGMVVGRMLGPRLVTRVADVTVLRASFTVAAVGAVFLRVGPGVVVRLAALAVAGLGLALVYPVAFSRLYGVGVPEADVGAVGALASGTAVTFSPLALGALADASSLGWALLIVPAMAVVGLVAVRDGASAGRPVRQAR